MPGKLTLSRDELRLKIASIMTRVLVPANKTSLAYVDALNAADDILSLIDAQSSAPISSCEHNSDQDAHSDCRGSKSDPKCHHPKAVHGENGCEGTHYPWGGGEPPKCMCSETWACWPHKIPSCEIISL